MKINKLYGLVEINLLIEHILRNPPIAILKRLIYDQIIYLEAEKVYPFQQDFYIYIAIQEVTLIHIMDICFIHKNVPIGLL
jgi:hypothetical protein